MDQEELEEVLPLDLNAEQAAVLIVICGRAIKGYKDLKRVIREELNLPIKKRSEQTGDDVLTDHILELGMLLKNSTYLFNEASRILIELDRGDDKKPHIIMKPNFKK